MSRRFVNRWHRCRVGKLLQEFEAQGVLARNFVRHAPAQSRRITVGGVGLFDQPLTQTLGGQLAVRRCAYAGQQYAQGVEQSGLLQATRRLPRRAARTSR